METKMAEKVQKAERVVKAFSVKKNPINTNSSPIISIISAYVGMEISICCYLLKNNNLASSHHRGFFAIKNKTFHNSFSQ